MTAPASSRPSLAGRAWASTRRSSPASSRSSCCRMAGIPLTAGFIGKWAVFEVALSAGAWPVVLVGVLVSAVAAFFYVRVIMVMYFQEPDLRERLRRAPVGAHGHGHRDLRGGHARARHRARAGARSGSGCGTIHQVTDPSAPAVLSGLAMPVPDEALARRLTDRMAVVEQALAGHVRSRAPFVTERREPPDGGRRQALPAAAGAARRRDRVAPRLRRRDHGGVRGRADPPRLALPRRRDGRGGAAPRGRVGQRTLGQPRRDPHRRLPVLEVLRADRRARGRRGADPGPDLHPARRGSDPGDRRSRVPATTRSSTTSTWSPARPGR